MRHIHSYSRYNPSKNKRAENSDHTRNSRSQNSQDLPNTRKKTNGEGSLQQPPRVRNNTERKVHRMYNRKGMGIIIITLLILMSCTQKRTCIVTGHKCIPLKTYAEWNKCISDCSNVTINSKTKPYKPNQKWIRPRPYAYP